jgi:hypothetical protein
VTAPVDWDQESYCVVEGCGQPAVHRILIGMDDGGVAVYEMVCCLHAHEGDAERRWTAEMWRRIRVSLGWEGRDLPNEVDDGGG